MRIEPYERIGGLRFREATERDCITAFGPPPTKRTNRNAECEYHYDGHIVRFDTATGRFCELTLLPYTNATIHHAGQALRVTWDRVFLRQLCDLDGAPVEAYGFLIFPRLGVTITGLHDGDEPQLAITVFARGDFDEFLNEAVSYDARQDG